MIVCIYEDRPKYLIGVKLTVLSLARHCPDLPVIISCPQPSASFRRWTELQPNTKLFAEDDLAEVGWNVKPTILLRRLSEGHPEVVWIDSDIIVNRDFRDRLQHFGKDTLVVTQEDYWGQYQGGTHRTVAWGLKPGRTFSTTVNTGIVRVTPRHVELLKTWQTMLNDPTYIQVQRQPYYQRPLHMLGDQEVLTALLGSVEFSQVPVEMLKRGIDIAQCYGPAGYTPSERLQRLLKGQGLPALIHSMGRKPWEMAPSAAAIWSSHEPLKKRLRAYYDRIHLELSPYTSIARQYRQLIGEDARWMDVQTTPARLFATLSAGHPTLQGFPLALFDAAVRHARRRIGIARYRLNG
ncbi:glycosyltransferase family protein [Mastigocladopsis repens]|uniref:hypothetical protein n=1 Tax=Mastigocladopsis repens TaxID=221287 RepID=UPI00035C2C4E|nr:hypothetical protein [Mastigocladopsis repens]